MRVTSYGKPHGFEGDWSCVCGATWELDTPDMALVSHRGGSHFAMPCPSCKAWCDKGKPEAEKPATVVQATRPKRMVGARHPNGQPYVIHNQIADNEG